jgi:hypothetical protein
MKTIHLLHFLILCVYLHAGAANANISTEVICTHAPSQNIEVFGAGTISATVSREIFLLENGLKHVQHSSGRKILINAAGRYIKGTLSRPVPGPVILVVGALVAGSLNLRAPRSIILIKLNNIHPQLKTHLIVYLRWHTHINPSQKTSFMN